MSAYFDPGDRLTKPLLSPPPPPPPPWTYGASRPPQPVLSVHAETGFKSLGGPLLDVTDTRTGGDVRKEGKGFDVCLRVSQHARTLKAVTSPGRSVI